MTSLTDKLIQGLEPRESEYHVWDDLPGFGVRVRPSGHKTYVLFYRPHNRKRIRKLTLGNALAIPRRDAHRLARTYMGQVAEGKDPAEKKLAYRDASLRAAFEVFKLKHLPTVSREHARHRERIFERNFLPKLGDKVLSEITRADIKEIIDRIARHHPIAASNAHRGFSAFLSWCQDKGILDHHVLRGSKLPAPYRPRERTLNDDELVAVWKACERLPSLWKRYFRTLIASGQRRSEVAGMHWDEIDLVRRVWLLPANRTKNRQQHVVPLTPILEQLLLDAPDKTGYAFPSPIHPKRPVHAFGRITDQLRKEAGVTGFRLHDLRRTAASIMGKIGVAPHVIEAILNHKSGVVSGIAAIYNRYGYEREKAIGLNLFSDYIEAITLGKSTAHLRYETAISHGSSFPNEDPMEARRKSAAPF